MPTVPIYLYRGNWGGLYGTASAAYWNKPAVPESGSNEALSGGASTGGWSVDLTPLSSIYGPILPDSVEVEVTYPDGADWDGFYIQTISSGSSAGYIYRGSLAPVALRWTGASTSKPAHQPYTRPEPRRLVFTGIHTNRGGAARAINSDGSLTSPAGEVGDTNVGTINIQWGDGTTQAVATEWIRLGWPYVNQSYEDDSGTIEHTFPDAMPDGGTPAGVTTAQATNEWGQKSLIVAVPIRPWATFTQDHSEYPIVTLDASGSFDLDGSIPAFNWSVSASVPQSHTGQVLALDTDLLSAYSTVTLTIVDSDGYTPDYDTNNTDPDYTGPTQLLILRQQIALAYNTIDGGVYLGYAPKENLAEWPRLSRRFDSQAAAASDSDAYIRFPSAVDTPPFRDLQLQRTGAGLRIHAGNNQETVSGYDSFSGLLLHAAPTHRTGNSVADISFYSEASSGSLNFYAGCMTPDNEAALIIGRFVQSGAPVAGLSDGDLVRRALHRNNLMPAIGGDFPHSIGRPCYLFQDGASHIVAAQHGDDVLVGLSSDELATLTLALTISGFRVDAATYNDVAGTLYLIGRNGVGTGTVASQRVIVRVSGATTAIVSTREAITAPWPTTNIDSRVMALTCNGTTWACAWRENSRFGGGNTANAPDAVDYFATSQDEMQTWVVSA